MANWPPKPLEGKAVDMTHALKSLAALQGHVTRAIDNVSATIIRDELKADAVSYAINKLEEKVSTYTEQQMNVVALCADESQVAVLDEKVNSIISASKTYSMP